MKTFALPIFFSGILFISSISCSSEKKQSEPSQEQIETTAVVDLTRGEQMLKTACYACHGPSADEENRMAPLLEAIKRRYSKEYTTEAEFVKAIADFTANPTEEKAIMINAVDRFGLMTPFPYPQEDLEAIATFMYRTELETPDWFEEHYQQEMGKGRQKRLRRQGQ